RRRRRGALELAIFLRELVRGGDEKMRMAFLDDLFHALLVRGVAVGMQEQDGDRLYALPDRVGHGGAHLILVELDQHLAVRVHALADLVAQVALDQWLVAAKEEIVGFRPIDAADLVDIAEALRGEERARRSRPLQNGVDRNGRAVKKKARGRELRAGLRHPFSTPVTSRAGVVSLFPRRSSPVVSSKAATSVKVPPTSAASRTRLDSIVLKRKLRQAGRRKRRYQRRPCAATPAISVAPAVAFARRSGITSPAKRPMDCRLSARVKSPKANC